ncbi:MAG: sigma-70 family RNA polymerase sigma factor, partial [Gammaproteobacteria bacterium]
IPLWLVRVAKRNAVRLQLKGRSRVLAEEQFEDSRSPLTPEEILVQAVESARIQTALEMLDPRCREILSRLFLSDEESTYDEIARDLKLAPNSLGPIRSRCLDRLRKILQNLDTELY